MPSTPLHVLFHEAFLMGHTAYGERGNRIALAPKEGETVLMFRIDGSGAPLALGIGPKEPRSDVMLVYVREVPGQKPVFRLVLLELKGGDHGHAIEQLTSTLEAVKRKLSPVLGPALFDPSTLRALIISRSPSPQSFAKKQIEFQRKWKFLPHLCRPDENELRKHLA